ncbi:unnamed protein product [Closterium sp. NIES-65]|nr:unnamed protein product [Closterium sp. NIES-65]
MCGAPCGVGRVLSGNQLSGSIPSSIAYASHLQRLWLDNNLLSGSLPDTFKALSKLTSLRVNATSLSGTLPSSLGSFTSLDSLNRSGSGLTCPADHTSCGPSQSLNSSFCQTCASFCQTCGTPASEKMMRAGHGVELGMGAIIGIAVVAVVILLLLLAAVVLFVRRKRQQGPAGLGPSLAAPRCTEFSLDEVQQMANKNHPNIVRLLGFAVGGDLRTRPEHILIYEFVPNGDLHKWIDPGIFGVLMLVVLTGRPLFSESAGETKHILLIASECLASGDSESLRDPRMDTSPKDAVLRVAELAVSCTVERTASRPSMAHIATQLQAVREEVAGKEELGAATKVDAQVQEMKNAVANVLSLDAEIDLIAQQFS